MIDFLKLQTYDAGEIEKINNCNLLNWFSETEKLEFNSLEVVATKKVKVHKGIYFCFYANRLEILFKPHYYFNDNLHNANEFKIIDCINILQQVQKSINIDLNVFKVVNIEFGINVQSPILIENLITYLAYHEKNEFVTDTQYRYSKKSYKANPNGTANTYKIIKAYAKGLQYPDFCDINTFRFEVKSKQSKYIHRLGINTANDLKTPFAYFNMVNFLEHEFSEVLILDCSTNFETLNPKEQKKIEVYSNPMQWYKFKNLNRNSFSKNKKIYHDLINKVETNLKKQLEKIIFDKLENIKKGANSTPEINNFCNDAIFEVKKYCAYSTPLTTKNPNELKKQFCINKPFENIKKGANSTILILEYAPKDKEVIKCKITGLNISMQKDNSFLISHAGLKFYYQNDFRTFEKIKQKYLSKIWYDAKLETQIKEIAHNIRNTISNQRIKQKRLYQPQQVNFLNLLN